MITTLRSWLDRLAETDRLAIIRPGRKLRYEIAAIANRFDGRKATFFPRPDGHPIPVVSGLTSDRGWMAEAMGVPPPMLRRFQRPSRSRCQPGGRRCARAGGNPPKGIDLTALLPIPTHNEHDSGALHHRWPGIVRNPETGVQNVSIQRLQLSGPDRLGALILPRQTQAFLSVAEARRRGRCRSPS